MAFALGTLELGFDQGALTWVCRRPRKGGSVEEVKGTWVEMDKALADLRERLLLVVDDAMSRTYPCGCGAVDNGVGEEHEPGCGEALPEDVAGAVWNFLSREVLMLPRNLPPWAEHELEKKGTVVL